VILAFGLIFLYLIIAVRRFIFVRRHLQAAFEMSSIGDLRYLKQTLSELSYGSKFATETIFILLPFIHAMFWLAILLLRPIPKRNINE